jgi:hypothetical protein
MNTTNHAIVQTLVNSVNPSAVPRYDHTSIHLNEAKVSESKGWTILSCQSRLIMVRKIAPRSFVNTAPVWVVLVAENPPMSKVHYLAVSQGSLTEGEGLEQFASMY